MSLEKIATSGIRWSSFSQVGRLIMQLGTVIILARLLSPNDFGLMGMATIVITFISLFSDLGTAPAIIQKKEISNLFLSSIFWINLSIGIVITILLCAFAPLAAQIYREPQITTILRVLSLSFLIASFSLSHRALQERNLAFSTLAKIEMVSIFIGSLTGISLAFFGYGVWSLIFQTLVVSLTTAILLWINSPWRPSFSFQWSAVNSVVNFSLNLTASGLLFYVVRNSDNFLIGTFLGTEALGFYTMAYRVMLYPIGNVASVVRRVMFPIFSGKQDDNEWLGSAYCRVANTIALVVFPLVIGFTVLCEPFVLVVLGSRWSAIIPLLMILFPAALVESIEPIADSIYQSKGRADIMFYYSILASVGCLTAFSIGIQWGLIGVCIAYVSTLSLSFINFGISFRLIRLSLKKFLLSLYAPLCYSLLMGFMMLIFKKLVFTNFSNLGILVILSMLGTVTYFLLNWYYNRSQIMGILRLLKLAN